MPMLDGDKLVFCFPDLGENARLTITFRLEESPSGVARLIHDEKDDEFMFANHGHVVMHLDPESSFAVLASIQGTNVLTGDSRTSLTRPQNYFVTPPQRVIDGYLEDQRIHRFQACADGSDERMPLIIKVIPMKAVELNWFKNESRKCGGEPRGWGTQFILESGGWGQREPIYEDTRSLGDWDQGCSDEAIVWLDRRR